MPVLHTCLLEDGELAMAYPLVRSVARVELDRWLEFARAVSAAQGGTLGARARSGCLYGAATFLPRLNLEYGRVLGVEIMAAFELGRGPHAERTLREGLAKIARERDCRALAYTLSTAECAGKTRTDAFASRVIRMEPVAPPSRAGFSAAARDG
ncbi:MAG: hypothetical protein K2Y17_02515 [Qipengyuania sp.]|nr:hypothetical protein [Qipengyuania sp.]